MLVLLGVAEAGDLRYGLAAIYQSKCKMSHEILAK